MLRRAWPIGLYWFPYIYYVVSLERSMTDWLPGGRVGNFRGMPVDQHATAPLFFFVICKYPPSLAYALLTLGVDMSLLSG